jgi:hypothetical protein
MIVASRYVAALFAVLLAAACTQVHNPDFRDKGIRADKIVDLAPKRPVRLTNGADPDAGDRLLAQAGYETIEGDLWKWTQAAVELARREIEARGGDANGPAENELVLEVSDLVLRQGDYMIRGIAHLRVEYGEGRAKTFTADVGSSRGGAIALEGALRVAVARMLSDREIQQRL